MARGVPPIVARFSTATDGALALASKAEQVRTELLAKRSLITLPEIEIVSLYEAAYLRMFVAWEDFLDRAFVYYMCGRRNSIGVEALAPGRQYSATIAAAENALYGQQDYLLWHNASKVVQRANGIFFNGGISGAVVSSALSDLQKFAAIRHRIAHGHEDSRVKFDAATMALAARRFPAGRPGRFLRSFVVQPGPPVRWIESVAGTMKGLAGQIVP